MRLTDKIKQSYLNRAREIIEKNRNSEDLDWFDDVLQDLEKAEAEDEITRLAKESIEKGEYELAIRAYERIGDSGSLFIMGLDLLEEVRNSLGLETEEEFMSREMILEGKLNLLYLAVDALEVADNDEAKALIEEVADFGFSNENFELGVYALEKGDFYGKLAVLGDEALVFDELDRAKELYEKAQAKEIVAGMGDLFVVEEEFEKAGKIYRESGNKEKLEFLMNEIEKKERLTPGEYNLMFNLGEELGREIPAEHKDKLLNLALAGDFGYLSLAVENLSGLENLERIGDACSEKGLYDLAIKAYERAERARKARLIARKIKEKV